MEEAAREVMISDYDPTWPDRFAVERDRLLAVVGRALLDVYHVGSTSVPGLAAKPIVDLAGLLHRFMNESEIAGVCALGYDYRGIDEDIQRQYFSKRREEPSFHLHCYIAGNPELDRLILFRDYLRTHLETAREYEELKRRLAAEFRFQRYVYQEQKTDFVRSVEQKAREE
jgi:GrpB-like predicted nucleotidyltransferase (UPF0157 family)